MLYNVCSPKETMKGSVSLIEEVVRKVTKIQNSQDSLIWGVHLEEEEESGAVFAVGHRSYPRRVWYFKVIVHKMNDHGEAFRLLSMSASEVEKSFECSSVSEVVKQVVGVLKDKFPAKGGTQ